MIVMRRYRPYKIKSPAGPVFVAIRTGPMRSIVHRGLTDNALTLDGHA
jgi:hypothetical protein